MRNFQLLLIGAALSVTLLSTAASAGILGACNVCTCQSGEIVCLEAQSEVVEEMMICNVACMEIGSTHGSREFFDAPCESLPQCNLAAAPAAGGAWLAAGALALLAIGTLAVRRVRARATA